MVEVKEKIDVVVFFKNRRIIPYLFFWRNRKIKVETLNLVHTSKLGASLFYHFSVSSGNALYLLKLDSQELKWTLEEVEE